MEAIQGMTNAMNAIANQVICNSGRSGRNAGWPYFDSTFRDYPAFKRKFESFQMTYHRGTPTRELFQQFREMCLPEKLSAKIKSANTMENAWVMLEAWFGDKALFIKDLMQDIKGVAPIKEGNDEGIMDYYVTLQVHIEEARNAGALDMLLIPANVELMVSRSPLGRRGSGERRRADCLPRTGPGTWTCLSMRGCGMPSTW